MEHHPMIVVVSRYNCARKSCMEKPNLSEWMATSLYEKPRWLPPKDITQDLSVLVLIQDMIRIL